MMLRKLVLAVVLLTSAFAPCVALNSSASHRVHEPGTGSAVAPTPAFATSSFDSNYKLSLPRPVQDKNFFLLSLFQRNPAVRRLLSQNNALKLLAASKASALKKAAS